MGLHKCYARYLIKPNKMKSEEEVILKAKELIELAILKNGENADATLYEHLGDIYFKLKNETKALENWNIALTKEPNNNSLLKKIKTKQIDE